VAVRRHTTHGATTVAQMDCFGDHVPGARGLEPLERAEVAGQRLLPRPSDLLPSSWQSLVTMITLQIPGPAGGRRLVAVAAVLVAVVSLVPGVPEALAATPPVSCGCAVAGWRDGPGGAGPPGCLRSGSRPCTRAGRRGIGEVLRANDGGGGGRAGRR
jgi:hypothetical protein